jgi:hypothetical protein
MRTNIGTILLLGRASSPSAAPITNRRRNPADTILSATGQDALRLSKTNAWLSSSWWIASKPICNQHLRIEIS